MTGSATLLSFLVACGTGGTTDPAQPPSASAPDDTGPQGETAAERAFEGEVSFFSSAGGETLCDLDVALSGTRYTGKCPGCVFAFDVSHTVTRDESPGGCLDPLSWLTFAEDGETELMMGWSTSLVGGSRGYYPYYDVFFSGDAVNYGFDEWDCCMYEGRWPIAFSSGGEPPAEPYGVFTAAGDDIRWEVHRRASVLSDGGYIQADVDVVGTGVILR